MVQDSISQIFTKDHTKKLSDFRKANEMARDNVTSPAMLVIPVDVEKNEKRSIIFGSTARLMRPLKKNFLNRVLYL